MTSNRSVWLAALVAVSLAVACGGGGGGGGGDGGGGGGDDLGEANAFRLVELGTFPLGSTVQAGGRSFAATAPISAKIASDTVSFALLTDLTDSGAADRLGTIADVVSPSGELLTPGNNLDQFQDGPLKPSFDYGANGLLIPKSPSGLPQAGTYTFRVIRDGSSNRSVPVAVAVRRGKITGRRIPCNVFVHDQSGLKPEDLGGVMDRINQIYAQAGLTLDPIEFFTGGDAGNAVIRNPGSPGSNLPSLLSIPAPQEDALTFWLLQDVTDSSVDQDLTLLGLALGIPGSYGWPRSSDNGVLVSVAGHTGPLGLVVDAELLAVTMAHEGGHWLGLNHTSEFDGSAHDPIGDTPECFITADANGNTRLDPDECPDAPNLMFWTGTSNDDLSRDQDIVLQRNPIAVP